MLWLFMQRDYIFVYQNNENMIYCLRVYKKKKRLFTFFSLSFTHSPLFYKKKTHFSTLSQDWNR
jgi:hypothetical protein